MSGDTPGLDHLWAGWRSTYIASVTEDPAPLRPRDGKSLFEAILHSGRPDDETFIVHRGERCFAILNAYPYTNGHVLVLPNLYGDVISDLCAGLIGGLGIAPGENKGDGGIAIFEATHGSAPKYKGLNKVNPTAMLLSGVLMLEHLGETAAASRLEKAIAKVIREGKDVTYDMKPDRNDPTAVGTREMGEAIIRAMK